MGPFADKERRGDGRNFPRRKGETSKCPGDARRSDKRGSWAGWGNDTS